MKRTSTQLAEDIRALIGSDAVTISPQQASTVVGSDPQLIRYQAKHNPQRLGFPVIVTGNRVKIPRIPFLRFMGLIDTPPEQTGADAECTSAN